MQVWGAKLTDEAPFSDTQRTGVKTPVFTGFFGVRVVGVDAQPGLIAVARSEYP